MNEKLSLTLQIKIGSALVHADEALSLGGHEFDKDTFMHLLEDSEVNEWLNGLHSLAYLPVKRINPRKSR